MNPWDYIRDFSESDIGKGLSRANSSIGWVARRFGEGAQKDYDTAKHMIDNTTLGNAAKNAWDAGSYVLSAPQQGVFGFGKEGSESFGKINNYLQDKGMDNIPATFLSAVGSIPAGIWGANKAALFSGRGNDIRGRDLTDGLFDSDKNNNTAGIVLDTFADPVGAFAGAANPQRVGTAVRTAKNLFEARRVNPAAYEKATVGGLWNALKMDISHPGTGGYANAEALFDKRIKPIDMINTTDEIPMVIRRDSSDIGPFVRTFHPNLKGSAGGANLSGSNVIVGSTLPGEGNVFMHETLHNTMDLLPGATRTGFNRNILDAAKAQYPGDYSRIEPFYSKYYGDNADRYLGEEMLAYLIERGMPFPSMPGTYSGKMMDKIWDTTRNRFSQLETGPAKQITLEDKVTLPNRLNNLWDNYTNE